MRSWFILSYFISFSLPLISSSTILKAHICTFSSILSLKPVQFPLLCLKNRKHSLLEHFPISRISLYIFVCSLQTFIFIYLKASANLAHFVIVKNSLLNNLIFSFLENQLYSKSLNSLKKFFLLPSFSDYFPSKCLPLLPHHFLIY